MSESGIDAMVGPQTNEPVLEHADAALDGGGDGGSRVACARPVDRVRVYPVAGTTSSLQGTQIQVSDEGPTTAFRTVETIGDVRLPYSEYSLSTDRAYRFVRLYVDAPDVSIAELTLYSGDEELRGRPFGTASGREAGDFSRAFDGNLTTWFTSSAPGGNYIGVDLATAGLETDAPTFSVEPGAYPAPIEITLATSTPGATVRYTVDGSDPESEDARVATGTIAVGEGTTTIRAIASAPCRFNSKVATAVYTVGAEGEPKPRTLKSYHIGNSLTDTIEKFMEPVASSAGMSHTYNRWTIPGAPVAWIWEHKGSGFGTPEGAQDIDSYAQAAAPIDHLFVQPYADPSLETQAGAAIKMYETVKSHSPNVQLWIYAQWPPSVSWRDNSLATGAGWAMPPWTVARVPTSWEEAAQNQHSYHEAFRKWILDRVPGKDVFVVPAGLAMVALKAAVEAGEVPGIRDFFSAHFADDEHLTDRARYFVTLVFYACMYGHSPEGRVSLIPEGMTAEQARIYQRLAWTAVQRAPNAGG